MPDASPLSVLIVIADEGKRYALDQTLRKAGFKIRDANSGAAGLRFATEIPDIIILDLHLPDMSGFEVCCRLKAHAATAFIPVLHLSDAPVEGGEFDAHLEKGEIYGGEVPGRSATKPKHRVQIVDDNRDGPLWVMRL